MKKALCACKVVLASGLLGAGYGSIAGIIYANLVLSVQAASPTWFLLASTVGLFAGAIYGFLAGAIGGCLGGPVGFGLGGITPGLAAGLWVYGQNHALSPVVTYMIWSAVPAVVGGALGTVLGVAIQARTTEFPGVAWLIRTTTSCSPPDWGGWRRAEGN